jgi:hypothetical protein
MEEGKGKHCWRTHHEEQRRLELAEGGGGLTTSLERKKVRSRQGIECRGGGIARGARL